MSEETCDEDTLPAAERDALLTISHGAVVTAGGYSLQRALLTGTEFVLVRGLGPVVYGVYAFLWRITQLLLRFVNFGSVQTLQRYVPAYADTPDRQRTVAGLAYATTAVVGVVLGAGLFANSEWLNAATISHPVFPLAAKLFAVLIAVTGFVKVHAALLRAVGSAKGEVTFNRILRPAVRLVGAMAALALGYSLIGVTASFVIGTGLLAVAGFPAVRSATGLFPTLRGSRGELRRFYNHATPIALSSIGKIFQNRVDIVLVGFLLTATSTGIYNVVLVLVAITWIPLRSFNQLLPPVASDLYSSGRQSVLSAVYTAVTRLLFTVVLPLVSVLVVFGREILAIFGPEYVAGYVPLVIYLAGVIVGSAVGATGWLLMMTDHQYLRMILDWLLAGTNVVLTYLFVLEFGLAGAALGTSVAYAVQNSIQVLLLHRYEGLWPFDASFLKPLAAATGMTVVIAGIRETLGGFAAVVLGILVGLGTFVGTLIVLGIDDRDRLVVRTLATRYRRHIHALVRS